MPRQPFRFKQFSLTDFRSAMKINTDGVLLGAWTQLPSWGKILDIGTGCGLIALMLAQRSNLEITAIDVHGESAAEAGENFNSSPWKSRMQTSHISFQDFSKQKSEKYSLIVCNPPFFSKSLLSANESKNIVKHDHFLSFSELLEGTIKMLDPDGMLSLIIPSHRFHEFNIKASGLGFFCSRRTAIVPKAGKETNRYLLEYSMEPISDRKDTSLTLLHSDNSFTAEYKELTRPFYLQF